MIKSVLQTLYGVYLFYFAYDKNVWFCYTKCGTSKYNIPSHSDKCRTILQWYKHSFICFFQLSVAKNKCEKRLHRLGGPEYKGYDLDSDNVETSQKVSNVLV